MISEKLILILKLGRLHFLVAGFLLYLLGVLLASVLFNQFNWERFIWGYLIVLPAHLMVNYSNDYFDQEVDRYSSPTQFSGGSGILLAHPELIGFAHKFSLAMIGLSLILAVGFSYFYNAPIILFLTISGIFLGWYYTAPPLKFSYNGMGEIATVLSGFIIPGLGFAAMMGVLNIQYILFSVPIMLFYVLFILSVEVPDREADQKGGKNTFIVRYGRNTGIKLMAMASALATLIFLILPADLYQPINLDLLALLSFIPTISAVWTLYNRAKSLEILNRSILRNINTLVLFVALTNIYLLILFWTG
jgi:1,4-dihydroxy-2-naphthoate octaprenyltransferase